MSITRHLELHFPISAERYIHELYFSEEFAQAMYMKGLGFTRCDHLDMTKADDGRIHRKLRLCPAMNAPKPVQKVLGDTQQYDEVGTYDPALQTWSYEVIPATMASKVKTIGKMAVQSVADNKCTVVFEVTFDVKIFGVGKVIERFMASQFDDSLEKQKHFMDNWIAAL